MGKLTVYVPDELLATMRAHDLSPSELLQAAIHDAVKADEREQAFQEFLDEGHRLHGPATPEDEAWVTDVLARAVRHNPPKAEAS